MPIVKHLSRSALRLEKGDITTLDVDAFVYYARPDLALGSGFGSTIALRGGMGIKKELERFGVLATGDAIVTSAGNMKAKLIVHAVGPRFQEADTEGKLRKTVLSALKRAQETGVRRLALPPMGAGFYGIPLDVCARVMLDALQEFLAAEGGIQEIIICTLDMREYQAFEAQFARLV